MKKLGLGLLYGVLFVLISYGVYLGAVQFFSIRKIEVVGKNIQVSVNERLFPRNLLFFPSDKIRAQLLHDNPILADIQFKKEFPHTLLILPTLRTAAAVLHMPARSVLIDEGGMVLADIDRPPANIPEIFAPTTSVVIGQKVADAPVLVSLSFIIGVSSILPVQTIMIADSGDITAHTGTIDILFTQDTPSPSLVATLQTLLSGFRIKGTLPKVIDLRFDKPVVTF